MQLIKIGGKIPNWIIQMPLYIKQVLEEARQLLPIIIISTPIITSRIRIWSRQRGPTRAKCKRQSNSRVSSQLLAPLARYSLINSTSRLRRSHLIPITTWDRTLPIPKSTLAKKRVITRLVCWFQIHRKSIGIIKLISRAAVPRNQRDWNASPSRSLTSWGLGPTCLIHKLLP